MEKKTSQLSTEQQLLQAREQGLRDAAEVHAMKAHGKVLGMDAFSWVNPDPDTLINVISSFPFAVHWVGTHNQIRTCLELQPELVDHIQSIIVYDRSIVHIERSLLARIPNVACLEGASEALDLLKAMQREKGVFLFTTTGMDDRRHLFDAFIEAHR